MYVNGVFELLTSGASNEAIAEHFLGIATERMELTGPTIAHMLPTVAALRSIVLPGARRTAPSCSSSPVTRNRPFRNL
jgi:hypothetical protein